MTFICCLEQTGGDLRGPAPGSGPGFPRRTRSSRAKAASSRASLSLRRRMRNLTGGTQRRRGAQFVHAQAEQQRHQHRVAGHLAADADPDLVRVGGVHGDLDQAQDGGVGRLVEVGDLLVHAVHGQRVLDEVVGADAEELDPLGQRVGDDGGGGGLDHRADLEVLVEGHLLLAQLGLVFLDAGRWPASVRRGRRSSGTSS